MAIKHPVLGVAMACVWQSQAQKTCALGPFQGPGTVLLSWAWPSRRHQQARQRAMIGNAQYGRPSK